MKPHGHTVWHKIGKRLAGPLSYVVANSLTAGGAQLAEAYWCLLLGKGAGSGWALEAEIKAAQSFIHCSSPIIFDVGANTGEWSCLIQQRYPEARIFLFEPQPACHSKILEKKLPGSVLIPHAASSVGGQAVKLYTSEGLSEIASMHPRRDSYVADRTFTAIEVRTVTVDDVIQENELPRVDFMKIDTEGHDLAVLNGARQSLARRLIQALSFEFGSGNINSRTFFHDFWDLLTPLGYRLYRVLPSAKLMPITEYDEDCEYFRSVTNYMAVLS